MSKKLKFNTTSTTASETTVLSSMRDITFDMTATVQNTTIALSTPEQAIEQSLLNALHLPVGGNVLFPERGAPFISMLFNSAATLDEHRVATKAFIEINEPRIVINDLTLKYVDTEFGERAINIDLQYTFASSSNINTLSITFNNDGK